MTFRLGTVSSGRCGSVMAVTDVCQGGTLMPWSQMEQTKHVLVRLLLILQIIGILGDTNKNV